MTIQEKDYDPALMQGAANSNTVPQTITDISNSAFAVGRQGATNPVFSIDASTSSVVTGVKITGAATGTAVAVVVTGSATDEHLTVDAKGAGTIIIGGTSTGSIRATGGGLLSKQLTEVVTATNVILAAESGSVFFLNSATEFVSTLPAVAAGLHFTFVVTAAPSGASYTVVGASGTPIKGHVLTSQDAGGSGDSETSGALTLTFVDGKAVAGDMAEFWCDGTNWFVTAKCKVFDAITIS